MDDDLHPIAKVLVTITAVATGIFALWCTVIAFTGGTLPLLGWNMDGGVGAGLLWLFVIDPIVTAVGYWLSMLIVMPIALLLSRRQSRKRDA